MRRQLRPRGWSEVRTCPWCQHEFTASGGQGKKRFCCHRCSEQAMGITLPTEHFKRMAQRSAEARHARLGRRAAHRAAGLTPAEAFLKGYRFGYAVGWSKGKQRFRRRLAA